MFIVKEGTPADKIGEGTDQATIDALQKWFEKNGRTLRTADQDKQFVVANSQPLIDEAFGRRNKQIEDDILATTGIQKSSPDEKYYEYTKRVLKDFKTKGDKITALESQIEKLEKDGGSQAHINEIKTQLKAAQDALSSANQNHTTELGKMKNQLIGTKIKTLTDQALLEIAPKLKQFDPTVQKDIIDARLMKFSNEVEAVEFEDNIIYKRKSSGETISSKTDGKPKNVREILMEDDYLGSLIDKGRKAGGAGSGAGGGEGDKDRPKWKDIQIDKTKIKSKIELGDHLIKEHKLAADSKEWTDAMTTLGEGLPLRTPANA